MAGKRGALGAGRRNEEAERGSVDRGYPATEGSGGGAKARGLRRARARGSVEVRS